MITSRMLMNHSSGLSYSEFLETYISKPLHLTSTKTPRDSLVSEETNTINYGLGWDAVRLAPFSDYGITALFKGGDTYMVKQQL